MIAVSCLNPAVDVTYRVDELRPGTSHRVSAVTSRAGGKGVNVARVLRQLGDVPALVGPAGGGAGGELRADLDAAGVPCTLVPVTGETRRTVTVVAGSQATVFNEPGPVLDAAEWAAVREAFARAVRGAVVAVLSGSLPPGVPVTAYAELVAVARDAGARVVLDADGAALAAALDAGPDVVKVNEAEACATTGCDDVRAASAGLLAAGARNAVVTRGADGVLALVDGRCVTVGAAEAVHGNPTGAGDAFSAALAHGLAAGAGWDDVLADAVAVSAAAVAVPHAGAFDTALAARLRSGITIEEGPTCR